MTKQRQNSLMRQLALLVVGGLGVSGCAQEFELTDEMAEGRHDLKALSAKGWRWEVWTSGATGPLLGVGVGFRLCTPQRQLPDPPDLKALLVLRTERGDRSWSTFVDNVRLARVERRGTPGWEVVFGRAFHRSRLQPSGAWDLAPGAYLIDCTIVFEDGDSQSAVNIPLQVVDLAH